MNTAAALHPDTLLPARARARPSLFGDQHSYICPANYNHEPLPSLPSLSSVAFPGFGNAPPAAPHGPRGCDLAARAPEEMMP